ncbi:MAG: hypothetical protein Q8P67_12070 [archaeon]|nr:hypothetical protein [archaeon]
MDVGGVEDGLQEVRNQLIAFGKPLSQVSSEDLFVIDTAGDKSLLPKDDPSFVSMPKGASNRRGVSQKEIWRAKPSAAHLNIPSANSRVAPHYRFVPEAPVVAKRKGLSTKQMHLQSLARLVGKEAEMRFSADLDAWDQEVVAAPEWPKLATMLKPAQKKPRHKKWAPLLAGLPSVGEGELDSSWSYNPAEEERQKQVALALQQEKVYQKRVGRFMSMRFKLKAGHHGMVVDTNMPEPEINSDDEDYIPPRTLPRPPMPPKKSAKLRRKEKALRLVALEEQRKIRHDKPNRQFKRLDSIEARVKASSERRRARIERQKKRQIQNLYKTANLGGKYIPAHIPALCVDETHQSLLNFNSEISPFDSVHDSLRRRNIIGHHSLRSKTPIRTVTYEAPSTRHFSFNYVPTVPQD